MSKFHENPPCEQNPVLGTGEYFLSGKGRRDDESCPVSLALSPLAESGALSCPTTPLPCTTRAHTGQAHQKRACKGLRKTGQTWGQRSCCSSTACGAEPLSGVSPPLFCRNLEGNVALRSSAAVFTYCKSRGLFAGVSLEGSCLIERKETNRK